MELIFGCYSIGVKFTIVRIVVYPAGSENRTGAYLTGAYTNLLSLRIKAHRAAPKVPNAFAGRSYVPLWALLHQRHRRYTRN